MSFGYKLRESYNFILLILIIHQYMPNSLIVNKITLPTFICVFMASHSLRTNTRQFVFLDIFILNNYIYFK